MEIEVREATREDFDALNEILAEGDAYHREALPHIFRAADGPARPDEFLTLALADEDEVILVAESGGQVVGLAHVSVRESPDIPIFVPRRYAHVSTVVVREEVRRMGVGRALMERVHRWALGKGLTEIELGVWEFNQAARAFYEQLGYVTTRRTMTRRLDP